MPVRRLWRFSDERKTKVDRKSKSLSDVTIHSDKSNGRKNNIHIIYAYNREKTCIKITLIILYSYY